MSLLCLDWRASFSCCFSSLSCSFLHYVSELPCVFVMSFPTASTLRQLMFITEHSNKVNITVPRFSLHAGFFFNKSLLLLIISYSVHWPYIWQRHACNALWRFSFHPCFLLTKIWNPCMNFWQFFSPFTIEPYYYVYSSSLQYALIITD